MKKSTDTDKLSDGIGFRKELIDEVKKYTFENHAYGSIVVAKNS